MNVSMASDTGGRGGLERHFRDFPAGGAWLVALVALNLGMCSEERKGRLGMVETGEIRPRFYGVASLTTLQVPVGSLLSHALSKFAVVGVFMAAGAGAILEAVGNNFGRVALLRSGVAIGASDREMRPRERESALLVLRDGVI